VDGSGWQGVYNILQQHGYRVGIVQNPTISLDDDVAVTKRVIAAQPGPVVLVGQSYGGVVITQADNDPKVAGLVYIAAFAPDKGESVAALSKPLACSSAMTSRQFVASAQAPWAMTIAGAARSRGMAAGTAGLGRRREVG